MGVLAVDVSAASAPPARIGDRRADGPPLLLLLLLLLLLPFTSWVSVPVHPRSLPENCTPFTH